MGTSPGHTEPETRWLATLAEVRRQAARVAEAAGVQAPDADGTWFDVCEGGDTAPELVSVDASGAWHSQQWLNAFCVLFFQRPKGFGHNVQTDDILFFVLGVAYQGGPGGPLLVRRKGAALPAELDLGGALSPRVDWCRSTLLNLVIQTSFRLTVAACRRVDIAGLADEGGKLPADATRVVKAVYASPMRVQVNVEGGRSKSEQPLPAYPDLCFTVDNFEDAFRSLVLTEPGWCYAVFLSAADGAASVQLFAGFVSYEMLDAVVVGGAGGRMRRDAAMAGAHWVKMKGPGGQGHADVAVTCLVPRDDGHLAPQRPKQPAGAGTGALLTQTLRLASSVAEGFVLGSRRRPAPPLQMRCALMGLSLPVDLLAAQERSARATHAQLAEWENR
ncbi:hypothetical protein WJX81_004065 [Elliptochloris bilobata]|uniref:Uncharacterized protein n=1 Tax=Elliptochloris bilobata TaxID=381761 RepID=A0AAW1REV3_9CHLO